MDVSVRRRGLPALVFLLLGAALAGQRQFVIDLVDEHLPGRLAYARAVAAADVDADGDIDLWIGELGSPYENGSQDRLLLNDGEGHFADATADHLPATATATRSAVFADVDGDGDLDVATACGFWGGTRQRQNRLYLNDGAGHFTDVTATHLPADADDSMAIAFGDVDGDGEADLVVGNGNPSSLEGQQNRLYLNDGTGHFADVTASRMPVDAGITRAVVLGDVDGDGDVDLVMGNEYFTSGAQNRLYLNDGTGRFTDATATRLPADSDNTAGLALCDVDRDGDLDLLAANGTDRGAAQNRLYRNDGSGSFTDVTSAALPALADVVNAIACGDVDGDGAPDLVTANIHQSRLYLNDGAGTFADATAQRLPADVQWSFAAALLDTDGDGDLDLALGNDGQSRLYVNDGTAHFVDATASRLNAADNSFVSLLGDLEGDGDLDLVTVNYGEQNRVYRNDGDGGFADVTDTALPTESDRSYGAALGDVDGDGDPDLVVANDGPNRLYRNDGHGVFAEAPMPSGTAVTVCVALVDVDGDGDSDLLVGDVVQPAQGRTWLYLNDGAGGFSDASSHLPPDLVPTRGIAFADVDGDGDVDLILAKDRQNLLLLNDGTGVFADASSRLPAYQDFTGCVAAADLDGDGDVDLVFGNDGQDRLYLNDGSGSFSESPAMPADDDLTSHIVAGDVDEDGDLDLVLAIGGPPERPSRLYVNDGQARFTDVTAARMPDHRWPAWWAALGDLDGDGDLDLVLGDRLQPNLLRQAEAPWLARAGHRYRLRWSAQPGFADLFHIALPLLSTGRQRLALPPYGTFELDPRQMISLPPVYIPPAHGQTAADIVIPPDPNLVGVTVFSQALLIRPAGPVHFTGVASDRVLR